MEMIFNSAHLLSSLSLGFDEMCVFVGVCVCVGYGVCVFGKERVCERLIERVTSKRRRIKQLRLTFQQGL